jgi:GNAT superfamily N-acetyltransferase
VTNIVTYVEMTDRSQLNPGTIAPGLTLANADKELALVAEILARIGAPYGWRSSRRTAEEWPAWFAGHPGRTCWLLGLDGEPAGIAIYDPHPGDDVEIETFGLLPEFTGKGLGGHALTLAIRQGWDLIPGTRRVWLHTSSADNPNALPNYLRRGFRTFKTEERDS